VALDSHGAGKCPLTNHRHVGGREKVETRASLLRHNQPVPGIATPDWNCLSPLTGQIEPFSRWISCSLANSIGQTCPGDCTVGCVLASLVSRRQARVRPPLNLSGN
jgi:hypothetical protein